MCKCTSENLEIPGLVLTHHPGMTELVRQQNRSLHLAEADTIAIALAPAAHGKRIAVFEKRPRDTACNFGWLGAIPGNLKQAAALAFLRSRDRAGAEQI